MNQHKTTNNATSLSTIPAGYTIGTAPDGKEYLVPSYMVPALDQAFASYQHKINLGVPAAAGGVSHNPSQSSCCRSADHCAAHPFMLGCFPAVHTDE